MLSYQHAYHAGNFADVHKHLWLYATIDHLLRKDSAITFIDTHAGRGSYPLAAEETARLKEYQTGVKRLWDSRTETGKAGAQNPLLTTWLEAIDSVQPRPQQLTHYPGSPWWLGHRLRDQDRLTLFELHPGEHGHLARQSLAGEGQQANIRRVHGDGLAGLRSLLPVKTPRLCVLVDPSFERKSEYLEVAETMIHALGKVRHAVLLLWYPLLPAGRHQELLDRLRASGVRKLWRSEVILHPPGGASHGMYGSGMLVANPPWGVSDSMQAAIADWLPLLGDAARHDQRWWVEE
ncbi:23S rRNA (adenine(2030)-N(6))-methyltransferase RlmJ [Halomonas sp. SCS19]|jgi:23S rRNA (adenine2030-N6)-methyltransferase|uniref:23S rRNA (adenine(2030)-N(6))-methyltransferase RlmJ n=1 Tax=Halomonas sp. SCS19 TaxID=2950870 RepID=UPI0032DEF8C2